MSIFRLIIAALAGLRERRNLILKAVILRQQLAVLRRTGTRRPCFRPSERLFWILLSRWWSDWRRGLVIIQPTTVCRWRRRGWPLIWEVGSRGRWRGGRPRIAKELRDLIVRMSRENFLWGAPRIHAELQRLGFKVSQATVSRYMPRRGRHPSQTWRTFLYNQAVALTTSWQTEGRGIANSVQVHREHCQHSWVRPLLLHLAEACSETSRTAVTLQVALQIVRAFRVPASPDHGINDCVRQVATAGYMRSVRRASCLTTIALRRPSPYRSRASPRLCRLNFRDLRDASASDGRALPSQPLPTRLLSSGRNWQYASAREANRQY